MSSIVTSILSSTVGLLWNKARDSTAAKLKDGDVTDAEIRNVVVRELSDIKSRIDGLSRANLLSSYDFLQEGVGLLNVSLDKSKLEQKSLLNETQNDRGETSGMPCGVESHDILSEALELSNAMGKLKVNSDKEFESAKKRFEEARKTATHAFRNEALIIEDRIFAAKLRIVSEILECLDSPETAITGCLSFLKNLHSLPAIQGIFSVYLNGGVKSILKKAERVENVKSVMLINYVVFRYVSKFSSKYSFVLTWPTIEVADRSFNPILYWNEVSTRKSMGEELTQHPNGLLIHGTMNPYHSAVNSHGDVFVIGNRDNIITVISRNGESKVINLPDPREGEVIEQFIVGLAVDNNNNGYFVRLLDVRTENGDVKSYVLTVLDENCNVKHECTLGFLEATDLYSVRIAINKNNNIVIIKCDEPNVYVCYNTGQLKHKFERHSSGWLRRWHLSISQQNEIMIPADDHKVVHFYEEEGNLKSTLTVPEGHQVWSVAFHYVIGKIMVLTYVEEKDSYFLLCFSEAGELETSTFICMRIDYEFHKLASHPSGPLAIVRNGSIIFI